MITCTTAGDAPERLVDLFTASVPLLANRLGIADYNVGLKIKLGMYPLDDKLNEITHPEAHGKEVQCGYLRPAESELWRIMCDKQPRNYEMFVCWGQPPMEVVETFCHEFVHLRQWVTGILRPTVDENGKALLHFHSYASAARIPYADRPWEHEALALQGELAEWVVTKHREKLAA